MRLDRQLCFPLYAAARLTQRLYKPYLEPLGLTYPQYIVLMILWEEGPCSVRRINERALLQTNTTTPLLKRMAQMGLVERKRAQHDERVVMIHLTEAGWALRSQCACIPGRLLDTVDVPGEDLVALKQQLDHLVVRLEKAVAAGGRPEHR
nr:MarR family transcriptional regulator [Acanthopleuribacter pedis]